LCEIPQEKINELEIPNGLPLIYDVKSKCIKLLDDGSDENMLERYNFGKAAPYLFRPCRDEDGNEDEVRTTTSNFVPLASLMRNYEFFFISRSAPLIFYSLLTNERTR